MKYIWTSGILPFQSLQATCDWGEEWIHIMKIHLKLQTIWSGFHVFTKRFGLFTTSARQSLINKSNTHRSRIKLDSSWGHASLNWVKTSRNASRVYWKWWKSSDPSNLNATLIFLLLELFLEMVSCVITMRKICSYARDNSHHLYQIISSIFW